MVRTLERRVAQLEARTPMRDPLKDLSPEEHERLMYLLCKPLDLRCTEELAEYQAFSKRLSLGHDDKYDNMDMEELERVHQALTNQLAEFSPVAREFASEKTWAGPHQSPSICGDWQRLVEISDLPERERASELLRRRVLNNRLESEEIEWLAGFLVDSGLDLGPEGPWTRDHLEGGFSPGE